MGFGTLGIAYPGIAGAAPPVYDPKLTGAWYQQFPLVAYRKKVAPFVMNPSEAVLAVNKLVGTHLRLVDLALWNLPVWRKPRPQCVLLEGVNNDATMQAGDVYTYFTR